jgi:uncharacterized membrane protein
MNRTRLEAFSDGVLAIIITIMVLEIKVPNDTDWQSIQALLPIFTSYLISFLFVGIYWGNHHNLLQAAHKVNSAIMLANLNLLFWLSLLPFATAWMGKNKFSTNTIILYAVMLILCGVAYWILQRCILATLTKNDPFHQAVSRQRYKVIISMVSTLVAIPFAFINPYLSGAMFILQSGIWIIPDKNIEKAATIQRVTDEQS